VLRAFISDDALPAETIHVTASDGTVTLSGGVDFLYQRDEAEEVARQVAGVSQVRNHLSVWIAVSPNSADACSSSRASAWGSLSDTLAHKSGSGRPRFRPGDVRPSSDAGGLSRSVLARRRAPRRRARSGSARASDPRPSSRPYGASLAG
jgi:hypothetical protein